MRFFDSAYKSFNIVQDIDTNKWYWRIRLRDGSLQSSLAGFPTEASAKAAAELILANYIFSEQPV